MLSRYGAQVVSTPHSLLLQVASQRWMTRRITRPSAAVRLLSSTIHASCRSLITHESGNAHPPKEYHVDHPSTAELSPPGSTQPSSSAAASSSSSPSPIPIITTSSSPKHEGSYGPIFVAKSSLKESLDNAERRQSQLYSTSIDLRKGEDDLSSILQARSEREKLKESHDDVFVSNIRVARDLSKAYQTALSMLKLADRKPTSETMAGYAYMKAGDRIDENSKNPDLNGTAMRAHLQIAKACLEAIRELVSRPNDAAEAKANNTNTTSLSPWRELKNTVNEFEAHLQTIPKSLENTPRRIVPQAMADSINKAFLATSLRKMITVRPSKDMIVACQNGQIHSKLNLQQDTLIASLIRKLTRFHPNAFISSSKGEINNPNGHPSKLRCLVFKVPPQSLAMKKEAGAVRKVGSKPALERDDGSPGDKRKRKSRAGVGLGPDDEVPAELKGPGQLVCGNELALTPIDTLQPPIPRLSYGLDRVLFNSGVYQLQDSRTGVYNFDPYLSTLMPIQDFDFNSLAAYVTSSKDTTLINLAEAQGKKYCGSTSSMTAILSHFHYLLSAWRPVNPAHTTRGFDPESVNFTKLHRAPTAAFLHHKDGTYAIDADKEYDRATVLSMLGHSMEKLLTMEREDFEKYRKGRSHELPEEQRNERNAYNYTTMGDFLMRSQLDARDDRLPGEGIFDLKTRAVISIRMDAVNVQKSMDYEIRKQYGQWESFEREYYDLCRSAFLKYSLQARMGRMDGIFVAYHNTQRIFGFQYFTIADMDHALHGTHNTMLGDNEFKLSLHLLNKVFDKATARYPGRSLRFHFETRPSEVQTFMYIFAKPVTPDEINEIQSVNRASIEEFERFVLGLVREKEKAPEEDAEEDEVDTDPVQDEEVPPTWAQMRSSISRAIEDEELSVNTLRETVEDGLEESGLMPSNLGEADTLLYVDAVMEVLGSPNSADAEATAETESETGAEVDTEEAESDVAAEEADIPAEDNVDISSAAMEQDEVSTSVPHSQSNVAQLKELLIEYEQQEGTNPANKDRFFRVRRFEHLVLSALAEQIGEDPAALHHRAPIPEAEERADELFGLNLVIRNKVDGKFVKRPRALDKDSVWELEYSLEEIPQKQARRLYQMVLRRRQVALELQDRDGEWFRMWQGKLHELSQKGRRYRRNRASQAFGKDVVVFGEEKPRKWEDAFEASHVEEQLRMRGLTTMKRAGEEGEEGEREG